ncbi:MAG TPA: hypothetical protein VGS41_18120, partial [Chthonomonadales bacterium]|nr:hypothetical protein [Chthonomonadales bacterium]
MLCRECGAGTHSPLFQLSGSNLAKGIAITGALSILAGWLLTAFGDFGFFGLWFAVFYGLFVGEAALRATG